MGPKPPPIVLQTGDGLAPVCAFRGRGTCFSIQPKEVIQIKVNCFTLKWPPFLNQVSRHYKLGWDSWVYLNYLLSEDIA